MANHSAIAAAFGGVFPPGITGMNDRCTVLVSNLDPDVSLSSFSSLSSLLLCNLVGLHAVSLWSFVLFGLYFRE